MSQLTAQDRHGCSQRGDRSLQDPPEHMQGSGAGTRSARRVPPLPARSSRGDLDHRAVPALPAGFIPTLRQGSGSVLGVRRRRQTPLDRTVPAGPGLRSEQREDQLVPGRKTQRVRCVFPPINNLIDI